MPQVQRLLSTATFRCYRSSDVTGGPPHLSTACACPAEQRCALCPVRMCCSAAPSCSAAMQRSQRAACLNTPRSAVAAGLEVRRCLIPCDTHAPAQVWSLVGPSRTCSPSVRPFFWVQRRACRLQVCRHAGDPEAATLKVLRREQPAHCSGRAAARQPSACCTPASLYSAAGPDWSLVTEGRQRSAACGVADGLGFGHNARAALITRGLAELTRLAVARGAHPLTMGGLAGVGDVILTCTGACARASRV